MGDRKDSKERRLANARRVAGAIINAKHKISELQIEVEYQKIKLQVFKAEIEILRDALVRALEVLHRPELDGRDMPGDLPIGELADICSEVGLRLRPSLDPIKAPPTSKEPG